jgi:hypothetical protein
MGDEPRLEKVLDDIEQAFTETMKDRFSKQVANALTMPKGEFEREFEASLEQLLKCRKAAILIARKLIV